jgi:hypothetical protein
MGETPDPDVLEARLRQAEAEADLAKKIGDARARMETRRILDELQRRHPSEDWTPERSVAIQRLLDEVRNDLPTNVGCFDRGHNRHNRS